VGPIVEAPDGKARRVELGGLPMTDEQRSQRGRIDDPHRLVDVISAAVH